ncbi:MAG: pirin family protein [Acidobacteriota bacterium]|nr:pirin family protein [Acidobacteriota bacterium]
MRSRPGSSAPSAPRVGAVGEERSRVEVGDSHLATVGRLQVRRALPRHGRRSVGAWCFADHLGPLAVTAASGLDIGPHPHCGLQTVTWLSAGEALHRDSLGTEQLIRPGELNLMTAGHGVAHAEEATGQYDGLLEGIQLWIALPEGTREGPAAFEHRASLPQVDLGAGTATVLVGALGGVASPARHDTPLVGADVQVRGPVEVALDPAFEHAVIVMGGALDVDATRVAEGQVAYLAPGRGALALASRSARAILLGGPPLAAPPLMWWNFVARTREEMDAAYASWRAPDGRFGEVASLLARVDAPAPYWRRAGAARA